MNYENKHRIESLAKAACPNNKKVSTTNKRTMKRYYYELMDEDYNSYEAAIPDGRIKARAIAQAKRAMRDLGIQRALLEVSSLRTSDILDIITVELD